MGEKSVQKEPEALRVSAAPPLDLFHLRRGNPADHGQADDRPEGGLSASESLFSTPQVLTGPTAIRRVTTESEQTASVQASVTSKCLFYVCVCAFGL
jgi:hypothetical protein